MKRTLVVSLLVAGSFAGCRLLKPSGDGVQEPEPLPVHQVPEEQRAPPLGVHRVHRSRPVVQDEPVAEPAEQRLELAAAAVHVADHVERTRLTPAVAAQRAAHDRRGVDLLDPAQHVHGAEALAAQAAQRTPELVPVATIGIPTICMVLLLLLPFYDRNPERRPERRPIATTAGILTIIAMAYLTFLGANAGSPNEIELATSPQLEPGKQVAEQSGCGACHKIGENGNDGPGPELTDIGEKLLPGAIQRTLENPTAPMPSYRELDPEKKQELVKFLSQLKGEDGADKQHTNDPNPE